MKKVNLFIIGTPRTASSTLYFYLKQHPEIFMSHPKQPNYFNKDQVEEARNYMSKNKIFPFTLSEKEYEKMFKDSKNEKVIGEATVNYIYSNVAAEEIKKYNPDAKIIVTFREPISFLKSFHNQLFFTAVEDEFNFERALMLEEDRKNGKYIPKNARFPSQLYYNDMIQYTKHLKKFYELFDEKQIKVIIYEDFKKDNIKVLKEIFEFLEVNPNFEPELTYLNAQKKLKSAKLQKVSAFVSSWYKLIYKTLPGSVYQIVKKNYEKLMKSKSKDDISSELKMRLKQKYKPEVEKLSEFIGRDLVKLWNYEE